MQIQVQWCLKKLCEKSSLVHIMIPSYREVMTCRRDATPAFVCEALHNVEYWFIDKLRLFPKFDIVQGKVITY